MTWFDWFLVGLFLAGVLSTVFTVGAPRKPITPGTAAWMVAVDLAIITGLLASRGALS